MMTSCASTRPTTEKRAGHLRPHQEHQKRRQPKCTYSTLAGRRVPHLLFPALRADPRRPRVLHDVHSAQQRTDPLHPANLSARHSRPLSSAPVCQAHDKKYILQKQKSQTTNFDLIVWGFFFCVALVPLFLLKMPVTVWHFHIPNSHQGFLIITDSVY